MLDSLFSFFPLGRCFNWFAITISSQFCEFLLPLVSLSRSNWCQQKHCLRMIKVNANFLLIFSHKDAEPFIHVK
ncbi:hypothetical protein BDN70DRAFT_277073 [Pholiota conissans]|uniref:Uncharacterized protein n=1 Tax=Pholiota conissans TaxID=109636 RepID=A0A9P5ZAL6_9AGAR|nr:hypothetical protein BDN70DRAFT_277073 [Pholiota conissans]